MNTCDCCAVILCENADCIERVFVRMLPMSHPIVPYSFTSMSWLKMTVVLFLAPSITYSYVLQKGLLKTYGDFMYE